MIEDDFFDVHYFDEKYNEHESLFKIIAKSKQVGKQQVEYSNELIGLFLKKVKESNAYHSDLKFIKLDDNRPYKYKFEEIDGIKIRYTIGIGIGDTSYTHVIDALASKEAENETKV